MSREQLLRVISGQAKLIGAFRVSLRYYSGVSHTEADDDYPHDAALLQKRALLSNRRVRKMLKRERGW